MGWKYIIIENELAAYPIIFPAFLIHRDMAERLHRVVPSTEGFQSRPVSAGVIESLYVKGVQGDSDTLRMHSRPEDEAIINRYKYFHGIK